MSYNFDQAIDRRGATSCTKWHTYGADVLPMWVADMDFTTPDVVLKALHDRVAHGAFGYEWPTDTFRNMLCERMERLYQWKIVPDHIIFLPGLVYGLNLVARAIGQPGDGVLVQTPVYPPFLSAPTNQGRFLQTADLRFVPDGHTMRYEIDYDVFEKAITPRTRLFTLCHPHNPIGHEYTREELARLGEICLKHNIIICSDEIHCDLMMGDTRHAPMASIAPEIGSRTITLMAPSKTFNMPALECSFAIVPDDDLRQQLQGAWTGIVPHLNILGITAAHAAYTQGGEWLAALRQYLTANRDTVESYVAENLPTIRTTVPNATYLAWLDCRNTGIDGSPFEFFLNKAKVALNDGAMFGDAGKGFVRLNYGCPRSQLMQALEQMKSALQQSAI